MSRNSRTATAGWAGQARLHAHPAVAVLEFRLIQNLKKNFFGIERGKVFRERAPEVRELLDETVVSHELLFEIAFGVDVNNDGEILGHDFFHSVVHQGEILRGNAVCLAAAKHRFWI